MKIQQQILFSTLILLTCFTTNVLAHNIKTDSEVGVTFHIEPDHSPRVEENSQAWFALTRRGGKLIALSECDCELKVYLQSQNNYATEALLNPPLIALSPEKYQNIPGANLVFPQPGIYQLELTGKPIQENNFTPFKVAYSVTVNPALSKSENQALEPNQTITSTQEKITFNREEKPVSASLKIYHWVVAILIIGLVTTGVYRLFK